MNSASLAATIGALERNVAAIERGDRLSRLPHVIRGLYTTDPPPTSWGPMSGLDGLTPSVGPTLDISVAPSGRVILFVLASIGDFTSTAGTLDVGYEMSGANTDIDHSGTMGSFVSPGAYVAPHYPPGHASMCSSKIIDGLNPGPTSIEVHWRGPAAGIQFDPGFIWASAITL